MLNKTSISIGLVFIASFLINYFERQFLLPFYFKLLYALLLWLGVIFIPKIFGASLKSNLNKFEYFLISLLFLFSLLQIFRSILYIDNIKTAGNNLLTLFGNEAMALSLIPPLFLYLLFSNNTLRVLRFYTLVLVASCFLLIPQGRYMGYTLAFALPLFYFNRGKFDKIAIAILIVVGFIEGINGTRILILTTFFGLLALVLPRILSTKLLKYISYLIMFLPLFITVWSLKHNVSIFELGSKYVESTDKELSSDSRTFLYIELYEDLVDTKSLWFGKGALSGYQSNFFHTNRHQIGRTSNEVYFLHLILKGGLVYYILIQLVLIIAVYKAYKYGKNSLSKAFAFTIACFSLLSFVGDFSGASILHIFIWVMVGFCLTPFWLSLTDKQLVENIYLQGKTK